MSRERFGATHWRTAEAQLAHGEALLALGQGSAAAPALREAAAVLQSQRRAQPRLARAADEAVARAVRTTVAADHRSR